MKKKTVKKRTSKVEKTRNSGTMTESQFWSMIRSTLRSKSRWWKPILECKQKARRKYTGENKRQKWEYLCSSCGNYFPEKEISVDHIKAVGTLKSAQDLPEFVENLFCTVENLQCLCDNCHSFKTILDNIKIKENDTTKF